MSPGGRGTAPGVSPRADRGAVAVQDLCLVLVPRGRRPVRVQDQGPAPPVDRDLVVKRAEQHAICGAGLAPVGLVLRMVHLARRRGLVASPGPPALAVPQ